MKMNSLRTILPALLAVASVLHSWNPASVAAGPPVGLSLAQALDTTNLVWVTGSRSWFGQAAVTHDGVDAAQSGAATNGQISFIETTVNGPGSLTFWWKIFTTNFDTFDFYIGGEYENSIYVDTDWDFQTWPVPGGPQTVRWEFVKDAGGSDNADAAWLDQVTFTRDPLPAMTLLSLTNTGANLQLSFQTRSNWTHAVEYRNDLQTGGWLVLTSFVGHGFVTNIVQPTGVLPRRFYHVNIY